MLLPWLSGMAWSACAPGAEIENMKQEQKPFILLNNDKSLLVLPQHGERRLPQLFKGRGIELIVQNFALFRRHHPFHSLSTKEPRVCHIVNHLLFKSQSTRQPFIEYD